MNEPEAKENMEKKCPQCGATLPIGALEGLCPACLLKQGGTPETGTQPEIPPFQPPTVEEVGGLFPQLEILGLLGKGGMGAVYKARQPALDRLVALKILPPQVAGAGFAERFNREARALAKLSHANIVAVYEFGQVNGLPYFIMEFVDGLNLRQLEQAGKLSPREALQIVPQICEALQFAHDEGIVHRDIKPDNILVDKKGRVKIADFGIAKIMGREANVPVTETKGVIGTPQYMAPEQVEKPQSVDHRADIFSLGVVFYEMLTGELPLGKFAPPSRKVEVDVRLDDVVLRALEKEPERRYQQASQVKTAVETIAGSPGPAAPADAEVMAQEILARDYQLNIRNCFQRAWALVQNDFWPIIGVSALMLLLIQAAWSTIVGLIAGGPLMGGLSLYYLKKIRKEQTNVGTAFSGFSVAFVLLFLGGLITSVLTFLGFLCLILPGIYFAVIWWFTLTLIIDKRLDFWSAMRLSRTVINRHFWRFLGFWLLCILMYAVGFAVCGIGVFFTAPIAMIAVTYAYEDIFGLAGQRLPSPAAGPFGTAIVPSGHSRAAAGRSLQPAGVGFALLLLLGLGLVGTILGFRAAAVSRARAIEEEARAAQEAARVAEAQAGPSGEFLAERLDAAATIINNDERAAALATVAKDAAMSEQAQIVKAALRQISLSAVHDQAALDSARLLSKHGLRREAIEIAKTIMNGSMRDQALSELAQKGPE
jgi:predicted Ser/Thr protein kinase